MKDGSNDRIDEQMRTELRELERRLAELKARMAEVAPARTRARGRVGARLVALRGLAAVGCAALLVAVLAAGAQNQSLTIDPNGVVKVSALQLAGTDLSQTLAALRQDVNSKLPLAGGTLTSDLTVNGKLNAGNSDIYFTKTDHNHSALGNGVGNAAIENAQDYSGLMILGRAGADKTRIVRMWDRVGISGNTTQLPQSQLDVKGEIRGKPWYSDSFSVDWNANRRSVKMTRTDRTVCFLTGIRGGFAGFGEQVWIEAGSDTYWYLKVNQGGGGRDIIGWATCVGAPDSSW